MAELVLLVCGGRRFPHKDQLFRVLDAVHAETPVGILVQGKAPGADTLAEEWAASRGVHCASVPALWDVHKLAAGPKRNKAMRLLRPDRVIAFPGDRGTEHMCRIAAAAGIPVQRVE